MAPSAKLHLSREKKGGKVRKDLSVYVISFIAFDEALIFQYKTLANILKCVSGNYDDQNNSDFSSEV